MKSDPQKIERDILQSGDVRNFGFDIKPGGAFDPANIALIANPVCQSGFCQRMPCLLSILVPIGIHVAPHHGRDIEVMRTLGKAFLTLLAIECWFSDSDLQDSNPSIPDPSISDY